MEGQLLDDVKMAEETVVVDIPTTNGVNGVHTTDADGDVHMDQSPTTNGHSNDTPRHSSPAPVDSAGPPTSRATSNFDSPQQRSDAVDDDDEARPPPAKRARKYSDADQASIANVSIFLVVRRTGVLIPFFSRP